MEWLELFTKPETYASLATLTALEVVLGIDNIVFITILAGRLPASQQLRARRIGLIGALVTRILLLLSITWVMGLKDELFEVFGMGFSGKDLILLFGGLFLMAKATHEIYENVERPEQHQPDDIEVALKAGKPPKVAKKLMVYIVVQIMFLDIVFSLDSVITAAGMVGEIPIMIGAVLLAVAIMMIFAGPVGNFVQKHSSVRVLALAFLVLIGTLLVAESMDQHIPKGYIYFAMAFSLFIELVNMRLRSRLTKIKEDVTEATTEDSKAEGTGT